MKKDKNFKGDHLFNLGEKLDYYTCRSVPSSSVTPGQREYAKKRQEEICVYMDKNDLTIKGRDEFGRIVITPKNSPKHLK